MLDDSRWKSLQSQSIVDSNGDPARVGRVIAEYTAYISLKRKMAAIVLCHFHTVHPLEKVETMIPSQLDCLYRRWV